MHRIGSFFFDQFDESHYDRCDLGSRHFAAGVEIAVIVALDEAGLLERFYVVDGPVREFRPVREWFDFVHVRKLNAFVVHVSHEERGELLTQDGRFWFKRRSRHTLGYAVFHRPPDRIGVVFVLVYVLEVHLFLHARDVIVGHSRKDCDDLAASH